MSSIHEDNENQPPILAALSIEELSGFLASQLSGMIGNHRQAPQQPLQLSDDFTAYEGELFSRLSEERIRSANIEELLSVEAATKSLYCLYSELGRITSSEYINNAATFLGKTFNLQQEPLNSAKKELARKERESLNMADQIAMCEIGKEVTTEDKYLLLFNILTGLAINSKLVDKFIQPPEEKDLEPTDNPHPYVSACVDIAEQITQSQIYKDIDRQEKEAEDAEEASLHAALMAQCEQIRLGQESKGDVDTYVTPDREEATNKAFNQLAAQQQRIEFTEKVLRIANGLLEIPGTVRDFSSKADQCEQIIDLALKVSAVKTPEEAENIVNTRIDANYGACEALGTILINAEAQVGRIETTREATRQVEMAVRSILEGVGSHIVRGEAARAQAEITTGEVISSALQAVSRAALDGEEKGQKKRA